jgi:murein DD-endopeptidase MepM/ murein hydrolase activator NlpD
MKKLCAVALVVAAGVSVASNRQTEAESPPLDVLTPRYYRSSEQSDFRARADRFLSRLRSEVFRHPLANDAGEIPRFRVPRIGRFGAGKGPRGDTQHHAAVDFHVGTRETDVAVHAAHDGRASTFKNAPKYRHYVAITKEIRDEDGGLLGKVVTIYAHVDLDLDEADGLSVDGSLVQRGEIVSRHLYSQTRGGPHLHFEVRYYRPGDDGTEEFYGVRFPGRDNSNLTEASAGPWSYGFWNPEVGYGFADPESLGIRCD